MPTYNQSTAAGTYTTVDLNTNATTDLYDPSTDAEISGVFLQNGGSTAVVQLEVTDGTDTAVVTPGQAGGDGIDMGDTISLGASDKLQANVTTVEGAAQSNTAVVLKRE